MLFVGTSIIHPSTEGVFLLCNILDLLIYSYYNNCQSKKHFRQFFFFITPSYFNICGMLRKGIPLLFYDKMEIQVERTRDLARDFGQLSAFLIYGNIFQVFLQFFS